MTPGGDAPAGRDAAELVGTGAVVAPTWRRARFWVAVAALLILTALVVAAIPGAASGPLDADSTHPDGSKAIVEVLRGYGVTVNQSRTSDARPGTVVVTVPQAWSAGQLRHLAAGANRLLLVAPSQPQLDALGTGMTIMGELGGPTDPGCDWPGAAAAGAVDLPADTLHVAAGASRLCYGGAVAIAGNVAVLGSASLLRNDAVGAPGVAALDVNLVTDDGAIRQVTWLLPGAAGDGSAAAPTMWSLFPEGVHRVVLWLVAVLVLLAVVCARRFGPVVTEPLPVVVRAAELVEGHGRLYRRARARDRAAAALRAGSCRRLLTLLGLPGATPAAALVAAAARAAEVPESVAAALLAGRAPDSDDALRELAAGLAHLERTAGRARTEGVRR